MSKLPNIYKNDINRNINNNKNYAYLDNIDTNKDNNIIDTINNIFDRQGYNYNINVLIKTKDKEYNTYLISKTKDSIYTSNNEKILIDEILSIEIL